MVDAIAKPRGTVAALIVSAVGHSAFIALALTLSPPPLTARPIEAVSVDVISAQQFEASFGAGAATPPPRAPAIEPLASPTGSSGETVVAREFYSASVLAEPGMAGIRRTLSTLADTERIVQLCAVEAIEQIGRHEPQFEPDSVVSYALADPVLTGFHLTAAGGAFRSRRRWYELWYDCTATRDYRGVAAFAFQVGEPIPVELWEAHNLIAADTGG